jgi:hypothetical protein
MIKQRVGSARYVMESEAANLNSTDNFVRHGFSTAFDGNGKGNVLRNANLAIALYDEDEVLVRTIVLGNPSEAMRKLMAFEFESEVIAG